MFRISQKWLMVYDQWLMENACDTFIMAEGINP